MKWSGFRFFLNQKFLEKYESMRVGVITKKIRRSLSNFPTTNGEEMN